MLLPAFALAEASDAASRSDDWRLQIGPAWRTGTRIQAEWRADAVRAYMAPWFTRSTAAPGNLPPLTGYADRDYLDGFVYRDVGTGDTESDAPDHTWFWGYENVDQYDGASVAFRSQPGSNLRIADVPSDPWRESERIDLPGVDFVAMRRLRQWGLVGLGLALGASWYPEQDAEFACTRTVARESRETYRYVDRYAAPYEPFPDAPYAGDLEYPGYLIPNVPDSRERQTLSSASRDWVATSTLTVEHSQVDLRLGPSLWLDLSDRLALRLTPQARALHVDTEARAHTVITPLDSGPSPLTARHRQRDWILGGGIEAEAGLRVWNGWRLSAAAAADWWSDDIEITAEPFDTIVELGQWTFSATLGREF